MFFGEKTHKGRGTTYFDNIKVRSQVKHFAVFATISMLATRLPKASCLTLEIKELRCYEVKIEESEKIAVTGSRSHPAVMVHDQWQSTGCCGSVAEFWQLKPEVSWV